LLRPVFDLGPPNALLDRALESRAFRSLAQTVFFHHRGLLSPAAWRDLRSMQQMRPERSVRSTR